MFSSVRAIINISITEEGLDCSNAFSKTCFPADAKEVTLKPIPIDDTRNIQTLCQSQTLTPRANYETKDTVGRFVAP